MENIVIVNDQPDFELFAKDDVSADFFVICESDGENIYESKIAGLKMVDYVARACKKRPKILEIDAGRDYFECLRPYVGDEPYTVILFANTPLVTKSHISMILSYIAGKQMNACRLEKGYVFRTDYFKETDEIFSGDKYGFSSNDFFEVKSSEEIDFVKTELIKRILAYHRKNGIEFEDTRTTFVDANSSIYFGSEILSNSVIENSSIAGGVKIGRNCIIKNSKIGEDVVIGDGAKIYDSIVKNGTAIEEDVLVKSCVVGQSAKIGYGSSLIQTGVSDDCLIENNVHLKNCRFKQKCRVLAGCEIFAENENIKVFDEQTLIEKVGKETEVKE